MPMSQPEPESTVRAYAGGKRAAGIEWREGGIEERREGGRVSDRAGLLN